MVPNPRLLFAVAIAAGAVACTTGLLRERRVRLAMRRTLLDRADDRTPEAPASKVSAFEGVPAPVQRYLRMALGDGFRPVRIARLAQTGTLRTDVRSTRWLRFDSTQTIVPGAPGFLWDARVSLGAGLHLEVQDALVDGRGIGRVTLASMIPLASEAGTPEMNSGSLHRLLAESVWCPTALLPGRGLQWSGIDDSRALATLGDGTTAVSLVFGFNSDGEVASVYTPGRWGRFRGKYVLQPWEGFFADYVTVQGLRVPRTGSVGWHDGAGWCCVWKGRLSSAFYEFG